MLMTVLRKMARSGSLAMMKSMTRQLNKTVMLAINLWLNVIKFSSIIYVILSVCVLGKPFQPSLFFVVIARAYKNGFFKMLLS
jgi:hypothetical protein